MERNRILFIGMPSSGKTTYIAALWDYINSDRKDRNLKINSLGSSESQYLEKIRGEWLQCQKVSRTHQNQPETVVMNVDTITGKNLILEIPDLSGELFNDHFQHREWDTIYNESVNQMQGILLFINPIDTKNRSKYIVDAVCIEEDLKQAINAPIVKKEDLSQNILQVSGAIDFIKWSEEFTSNQVKLVDSLQMISNRNGIEFPIKISVIISQWDSVDTDSNLIPDKWLQLSMPLLYQYLVCNNDLFQCSVFGVSAQGGEYGDIDNNTTELERKKIEDERKRLLSFDPFERPKVKKNTDFINDLAIPITWLEKD